MKLEEKIKQAEIKTILIVDDTKENIEAAKAYFNALEAYGVKAEYAMSAEQAKQKIREAYKDKMRYSVIISDMQMEEQFSGLKVAREGFKHQTYSIITTGQNYHMPESHGHGGPYTQVLPYWETTVNGKKERLEVWKQVFDIVLEHMTGDDKKTIAALGRYHRFPGKPSDAIADMVMKVFAFKNSICE
jgi:CheY-like chemotaxis protein